MMHELTLDRYSAKKEGQEQAKTCKILPPKFMQPF